MTVKFCYTYAPDGVAQPNGEWGDPNTMTFKVVEGDLQPSVVAQWQPQCMSSMSAIYTALNSTLAPGIQVDGFKAGQLLYSAAANAFQSNQWPTSALVWVPEESELQVQVDGVKVARLDLDDMQVYPVE